jgi:CheY-like chemotaxis protein
MSDAKQAEQREKNSSTLIYVVDDEAMLLELAKVILTPLGYQVQTFRDPDAAVRAYTVATPAQRPALIITDYSMHNMTGMDLITECKRLQPTQKIILVSGTVGEEVFIDSAIKPDRYLAKPYEIRQLTETIQSLLSK